MPRRAVIASEEKTVMAPTITASFTNPGVKIARFLTADFMNLSPGFVAVYLPMTNRDWGIIINPAWRLQEDRMPREPEIIFPFAACASLRLRPRHPPNSCGLKNLSFRKDSVSFS
jgi:hypothetical protein